MFCSNPDALGIDESEKGIFDSLKNITQLPPSPPKDGGGKVDSATGAAGDVVPGEAGRNSPAASVSECPCEVLSSGFLVEFLLTSLYSSDKQSEDRPRSP